MKKKCNKCHTPKELNSDNFKKVLQGANGFGSTCKECISKIERERYIRKKEEKKDFAFIF